MENQDPNDANKDYTGAPGTEEPVAINSEEDLDTYLEKNKQGQQNAGADTEGANEGSDDGDTQAAAAAKDTGDGAGSDDGGDSDEGDTQTYSSTLGYLNDRFKIGMNEEALKGEITDEEEAEAIGDIFEQVLNGVQAKTAEYAVIDNILKDEEIKGFIEAKKEGKTLKDYVGEFAGSPQGMADETLVRQDLKTRFPKIEDEKLNSLIEQYKTQDLIESMASDLREKAKTDGEAEQARKAKEKQDQIEEQARQREQEVKQYQAYITGLKDVYGIPLSDDMKSQILTATTQLDANGDTFMDRALQSDDGLTLAAIGILHLKEMLKATSSAKVNRQSKSLADRLFEAPDQLQSGGKGSAEKDEFDPEIANQF